MSDEPKSPASNPSKRNKSYGELAKEYPDNPGIRMFAEAEAEWKRNGGFGIFDHHLTPPHAEPAPTTYSADVIHAVRRILAKLRRTAQ